MTERSVPSVVVVVGRDGEALWEEGFGWADREKRIPATEHVAYSVASVSKPLTATAIMTLVESGRLGLDRPANDHLGSAKLVSRVAPQAQASVRQLLSHTAGLPTHFQFIFEGAGRAIPSKDEPLSRYGNLVAIPGETADYSNLGFGVLDAIVEHVSGEPFADYMRSAVFLPLGMLHSSVGPGPGMEASTAARYGTNQARLPDYATNHEGAGGVYASAHDLLRFAMFNLGERLDERRSDRRAGRQGGRTEARKPLLQPGSLEELHRPQARAFENWSYGLGWLVTQKPGGYRIVHHSGGMPGVAAHLLTIPSERIALVILVNTQAFDLGELTDRIFGALLPRWPAGYLDQQEDSPVALPAGFARNWQGSVHTYERSLPLTLEVLASGEIAMQLEEQPRTLLDKARYTADGLLRGESLGDLRTADVNCGGNRYKLMFRMKWRGDRLTGSVTAFSTGSDRDFRSGLGHYVELRPAQPTGTGGP